MHAAKYKQKETNYPAIKLPFSGKLLTVNAEETSKEETTSEDNARDSVSAATPQFYVTGNKAVYAVPPAKLCSTPTKISVASPRYIDINVVKKQLFRDAPSRQVQPSSQTKPTK